jgi:5-methylcytosine-specific restriction endonuclease McrA
MKKLTKQECLDLGVQYIKKHKCYPAAKGWNKITAGCSRNRIYENWSSWNLFVEELKFTVQIPTSSCTTNPSRKPEEKNKKCLNCGINVFNKYCSNKCQKEYENSLKVAKLLNGDYIGKNLSGSSDSWLRKYLIEIFGEKCVSCGISNSYNGKPLTLEIDHIDGKSYNNVISNLRFLCPNCHSQTDTYKAKNTKSDRISRYKNEQVSKDLLCN